MYFLLLINCIPYLDLWDLSIPFLNSRVYHPTGLTHSFINGIPYLDLFRCKHPVFGLERLPSYWLDFCLFPSFGNGVPFLNLWVVSTIGFLAFFLFLTESLSLVPLVITSQLYHYLPGYICHCLHLNHCCDKFFDGLTDSAWSFTESVISFNCIY